MRSKSTMATAAVDVLLAVLDQAFDSRSWHGPNLRSSIRGLSAADAEARPAAGRHSIAEQTVHAAYWKYVVRRRLTGEKRGSFELKGSNWFKLESPLSETAWRSYVALLEREHQRLRDAVVALGERAVAPGNRPGSLSLRDLITGIAAHDVYHAGQINLLKRMLRDRGRGGARSGGIA